MTTQSYDPAGNPLTLFDGSTLTTYSYSGANRPLSAVANGQVTTYTNDLAGNRTSKLHPDGINAYYSWDAAGRMTQVEPASGGGTVSLTYNADGQRVVKEHADGSATGFLYDYKRLLHETDDAPLHLGPWTQELADDFYPRLEVFQFSAYAPELNPVEQLWTWTKDKQLVNFVPTDLGQLAAATEHVVELAERDQSRLQAFFDAAELPW